MHYSDQMRGTLRAECYWTQMWQTCPGSLACSSAWGSASWAKVPQVSSFYKGPLHKAARLGCDILTLKTDAWFIYKLTWYREANVDLLQQMRFSSALLNSDIHAWHKPRFYGNHLRLLVIDCILVKMCVCVGVGGLFYKQVYPSQVLRCTILILMLEFILKTTDRNSKLGV